MHALRVAIEHGEVLSSFVTLAYYDKINGDIIRARAIVEL